MRKASEDYIGVCQCCFGEYKVSDNKLIVLHGYRRPGIGYIQGSCAGVDHQPFEYDCALTKEIIRQHRAHVAGVQAWVQSFQAGKITTLTRRWTEYKDDGAWNYSTVEREEEIGPDSPHWEKEARKALAQAEFDIRYVTRIADEFQARVDAWEPRTIIGIDTPPTGKVRWLRDAYDPKEEDEQRRREEERAAREAKPGKLRLTLYWDTPPRNEDQDRYVWKKVSGDEMKAIKAWVKATFSTGKQRVTEGYGTSDVPTSVRRASDRDRTVVIINIDWRYLEQIPALLPHAQRINWTKKQVEFHADVTPSKPWQAQPA